MTTSEPLKKVAIAGATGHIRRIFVTALIKIGRHELTALTRNTSKANLPEEVKCLQVDFDYQNNVGGLKWHSVPDNHARSNSLPVENLDEATKTAMGMVQSGWNPLAQ
ncbi:hypothetical protein IQ06DRAFT_350198 [Phaeosphaeriaceae sp. SRC1lsM3a]|nr:hypothetical protein IQ06DRAFT_350198 [Stagonospora sp. SRC1lsM3a]